MPLCIPGIEPGTLVNPGDQIISDGTSLSVVSASGLTLLEANDLFWQTTGNNMHFNTAITYAAGAIVYSPLDQAWYVASQLVSDSDPGPTEAGGGAFWAPISAPQQNLQQIHLEAGHTFAVGDPVYFDGTNWQLAQADNAATVADGIVASVNGDNFTLVFSGVMPWGGHGLNVGDVYFLSQTAAGGVTTTQPTTGVVQEIFTVWDAGSIMIDLNQVRNSVRNYESATASPSVGHWYFIEDTGTVSLPTNAVVGDTIRFFTKGAGSIGPGNGFTLEGESSALRLSSPNKIFEATLVTATDWSIRQLDNTILSRTMTADLTLLGANANLYGGYELIFDKSNTGNTDS